MSEDEALRRAEELLERLEAVRARLGQVAEPGDAIEVLAELDDIARTTHAALERARLEAS